MKEAMYNQTICQTDNGKCDPNCQMLVSYPREGKMVWICWGPGKRKILSRLKLTINGIPRLVEPCDECKELFEEVNDDTERI